MYINLYYHYEYDIRTRSFIFSIVMFDEVHLFTNTRKIPIKLLCFTMRQNDTTTEHYNYHIHKLWKW